jgi:hypothetical protein
LRKNYAKVNVELFLVGRIVAVAMEAWQIFKKNGICR